MAETRIPHSFFYLFDATEFDARAAAGLFGAHPISDFFVGKELDVGMHFIVQFALSAPPLEKIACEAREPGELTHDDVLLEEVSSARAMASDMRLQRLVSDSSWRRPALVSL